MANARKCQKLSAGSSRLFRSISITLRLLLSRSLGRQKFMAKRTKITIETDTLLIARAMTAERVWCPQCNAESEVIAMEDTAVASNLNGADLEEWLNSQELHRLRTPEGRTLMCLASLLACMQKTPTANCEIGAVAQPREDSK
jgi:hypothetical protein